jgi:hypothetical protein
MDIAIKQSKGSHKAKRTPSTIFVMVLTKYSVGDKRRSRVQQDATMSSKKYH